MGGVLFLFLSLAVFPAAAATTTYLFNYDNRAALVADGWSFIATTPGGGTRDTEQTTNNVVSYDQVAHPGALRIPVDTGDLWANFNNTRNTLFRNLSSNWTSLTLEVRFYPTLEFQQVQLGIYQDDNNYLQAGWAYNGGRKVTLINENGGASWPWSPREYGLAGPNATNLHLRLERDLTNDFVSALYSTNGTTWTKIHTSSHALTNYRVAIWAGGSSGGLPNCDLIRLEVVTSNTSLQPILHAQPRHLVFNAVQGEACTNRQQVQVVLRRSQESRNWNVTTNATWLSTTVASGATPSAQDPSVGLLDVFVNSTSLAVGTYRGKLTFTGSGLVSNQLDVTLIVNPNNRVRTSRWGEGFSGAMTTSTDDSQESGSGQLLANNMRGTFYLWGLTSFPDWASDVHAAGMELGTHTISHPCYLINEPALRYELEACIDLVAAGVGIPPGHVISHCWPCGFTHTRGRSIAADYFLSARGYNINQLEDATPNDFMNLKSYNSHEHNPFPPADFKTLVDDAVTQRKWFNLVLHAFNNDDGAIAYGAGKDLWIRPVGEVVKYMVQRDRTIITNYSANATQIHFDAFRLPMPAVMFRNFETNLTANDQVTFEVDVTGHPSVGNLTVESVGTPYTIRDVGAKRMLYFHTTLTTNFGNRTVHLTLSNATPVAVSQWVNAHEDTATNIVVVGTTRVGNSVSYTLLNGPTNGALSGTLPNVTYTPTADFQGGDLFRFRVTDNTSNLRATGQVSIAVAPINDAPVLPVQTNVTIHAFDLLTVTNTATDIDQPGDVLAYSFLASPAGASVSSTGVVSWTPDQTFVGTTNTFTIRVLDNGSPPLSATNSFQVVVLSAGNNAPVLPLQTNRVLPELTQIIITNTAADPDGADAMTYNLVNPPEGVGINSSGVITWLPSEVQGPGIYAITTIVTDDGDPALSATNSFELTIAEVNEPPVLPLQTNRTAVEFTLLSVVNTASDADQPANSLTHELLSAPVGASISPGGVITWTPGEEFGDTTNTIVTRVVDNGSPALSATNSFVVITAEENVAPEFAGTPNDTIIAEHSLLTVTNVATDADLPANPLTYQLLNAPGNAGIDTNGVITWTPGESEGPGTNVLTTVVSDGEFSVTNSFTVVVTETNAAPGFVVIPDNATMAEHTTLTVTNNATDPDLPTNTLTYQLLDGPGNAVIDAAGVITWTPGESEGPGTNNITTIVSDGAVSATNVFTVIVTEVNEAPVLPVQNDRVIAELELLTVTNTATDADLPANTLSYQLVNPPVGAAINAQGIISWYPGVHQGGGTNLFTTVMSDGLANATNQFSVTVEDIFIAVLTNVTLIATGAIWKYQDTGVDQGSAWRANVFDDSTWSSGPAQLGFGDGDEQTVVSYGGNSSAVHTTTYFRRAFDLTGRTNFSALQLRVLRDDGAVVYLNGTEVFRDNLPAGVISYGTLATNAITGDAESTFLTAPLSSTGLINGLNVVAVEIHQNQPASSDLSFDFELTGVETMLAPMLPVQTNRAVAEATLLTVTNQAVDLDTPATNLVYQLSEPPTGAGISSDGVITWSPLESHGPGIYTLKTRVSDGILSATNSFDVTVLEVNQGPVFEVTPADQIIAELETLMVTNRALDGDLPVNNLTYYLIPQEGSWLSLPGPTISPEGIFEWTPGEMQGPSTNHFSVVVEDDGVPALSATNGFSVVVLEVNMPPTLPVQTNQTIDELTLLVVTNTVVDMDWPTNAFSYQLLVAPAGASINAGGIINWTPLATEGPSTNEFVTMVTDNGFPPLSATNSFLVAVQDTVLLPFAINAITLDNNQVIVTWDATPGRTYRLQAKDNLHDPDWGDVGVEIIAQTSTATATNALNQAAQQFYRVRLLP